MCLGCHCACWVLSLLSDAFSFSCSILLDIPAALVTDKDSTVQRHRQKIRSLSHMPEAAGRYRMKGQYKEDMIICSVNPLESEMDSSIKSNRQSIYECPLLENSTLQVKLRR